jgi:hypothetical protein
LATRQAQLIHSIHLPNVVGLMGAADFTGGASARRRRRQRLATKPTLQRSCTGAVIVALFLQDNPDQSAAPAGVLLSHLDHLLELITACGHLLGLAAIIIGLKSV